MDRPAPPLAAYVALLVAAVAVSSFLGLRGWMGIWLISPVADVVFAAGSLLAFHGAASLRIHWAVAGLLGFFLHWTVYALSWALVVAQDSGKFQGGSTEVIPFVASIGWMGLVWCVLATGGLSAWRQWTLRVKRDAAPAR